MTLSFARSANTSTNTNANTYMNSKIVQQSTSELTVDTASEEDLEYSPGERRKSTLGRIGRHIGSRSLIYIYTSGTKDV